MSMQGFEEAKKKILSFLGRKVRIYTTHGQPVEGKLVFISMTPPYFMIIIDTEGYPHMFNMKSVFEVEAKEKFELY
ncbi:MAG: hypothetical protein QXT14_06400 [Candidatus Bathyarchaeia archaeon]